MNPDELDIRSIVDDLVHQFADPLAFLRELVQNAIDAGTGRIEVNLDFEEREDAPSRSVISVRDFGEGMDRQVIEEEFVRLFSSGKSGDLTQVGQFGIGFVSVFAVEPDAVVVDTGRHGEYWRVVFDEDRSWDLYRLEMPLEGTEVRIYQSMNRSRYETMRIRVRDALEKWCRHPEVPVLLEGEDVRSEFDVPSKLKIEHAEEGTRIVMGMFASAEGPAGYYNRGLTLDESRQTPWPWVTYKIDSRYLEHTLSRDELLEDRHFSKAMNKLGRLAEQKLPELLVDQIEQLATDGETTGRYPDYCRYLAHYLKCGREFRGEWRDRRLFRTIDGDVLSWREATDLIEQRRLLLTRVTDLSEEAPDEEQRVVVDRGLRGVFREAFAVAVPYFEERFLVPRVLKNHEDPEAAWLKRAVRGLLDVGGWTPEELAFVPSRILPIEMRDGPAMVVPSTRQSVVPAVDWKRPGFDVGLEQLAGHRMLIVNTDREMGAMLAGLAEDEPEWAAYSLLEGLFDPEGAVLAGVAAAARNRRIGEKS